MHLTRFRRRNRTDIEGIAALAFSLFCDIFFYVKVLPSTDLGVPELHYRVDILGRLNFSLVHALLHLRNFLLLPQYHVRLGYFCRVLVAFLQALFLLLNEVTHAFLDLYLRVAAQAFYNLHEAHQRVVRGKLVQVSLGAALGV